MNRIIGIDPGSALCGWAIIEAEAGRQGKLVASGCIKTSPKDTTAKRLELLYNELQDIIKKYHPHEGAVEELFFVQNIKTGIVVGQARGAILLALSKAGLPVYEYKPTVVKMALTGYGRAEKKQVQSMVKLILRMDGEIKQDDEADAVAVAICHMQSRPILSMHANPSADGRSKIAKSSREKDTLKTREHAKLARENKSELVYPELSYEIVGVLFDAFKKLGPGLPEKYYYSVVRDGFKRRNLSYCEQKKIDISGLPVTDGRFFIDFVVEEKIVVELKVGSRFYRKDINQIMNYLRQTGVKLGILARFSQNKVVVKRLLLGK